MVLNPPIDRLAEKVTMLLPFVNEVVIVDTGSSQEDVDIMRSWQYPNTAPVSVVSEPFIGFGPTRTQGLARHKYEWTFIQDPDELPSFRALEWMRFVTSEEGQAIKENRQALGWLMLSLNWWAGRLGPQEEYHWHARLWRTKGSYMVRNLHELAVINGKHESTLRNTNRLPKAPSEAYVIHSKGRDDIVKSDALYNEMGGHSQL